MYKKLILHDLSNGEAEEIIPQESAEYTIFPANPAVHHCIGCFGCWVKTPGRCVLKDRGSDFAVLMSQHDQVIVISRLVFGGLSPEVKSVLDRSIGFILPFFRIVDGEMHHTKRYEKSPDLSYLLYGPDINEREKATAQKLVAANALNFGAENYSIAFYQSFHEMKEALA